MSKIKDDRFLYFNNNNHINMTQQEIIAKSKFEILLQSLAFEELSCAICQQNSFKILSEVDRYGFYYPTGICQECGHIQQTKFYKNEYLNLFYETYNGIIYRGKLNPESHFEKGYLKSKFYYDLIVKYKKKHQ